MSYEQLFFVMVAVLGVSIAHPWHTSWPTAKWCLHLPLLWIPLWAWYEAAIPRSMNIRVDLLLIFPMMALALLLYAMRVVLFLVI